MMIAIDVVLPRLSTSPGSVAKNLAVLQNQWKASQLGYLYAINRSIMIQKAIVIA